MNRRTIATLLALVTLTSFVPHASAAAGRYTSPTVCNDFGLSCTQATVEWAIVPAGDKPCTYLHGTGDQTTYSCRVHYDLTVNTWGLASCGWGYMEPTGAVTNCVALDVGITFPEKVSGAKDYTVRVGSRWVEEELHLCVDYSTPTVKCAYPAFQVPVQLPALDPVHTNSESLPAIIESVLDTVSAAVEYGVSEITA